MRAEDVYTHAASACHKAVDLFTGDRATTHGDVVAVHLDVAARWSRTLGCPGISPHRVLLCMVDLKLSRMAHGTFCGDDYDDAIAYLALAKGVRTETERKTK